MPEPIRPTIANTLLQGWDANDLALANGDPVETWMDVNGVYEMDTIAVPNGTTPHFQTNSLNGHPGVVFEGGDYLGVAGATMNHITLFMVVDAPANTGAIHNMVYSNGYLLTALWTTPGRWIFGRDQFSFMEFTNNTIPGAPTTFTFLYLGSSNTSKLRINGTQVASGPQFEGTTTAFRMGHDSGGQSDFVMYECLVYDGEVSSTDLGLIESYLTAKWYTAWTVDPPAAPSDLVATRVAADAIELVWVDNATDENTFRVEMSDDGLTGWTMVVDDLGEDSTNYNVVNPPSPIDTTSVYHFRVFAVGDGGDSTPSNVAVTEPGVEPVYFTANGAGKYVELFIEMEGIDHIDKIERIGPGTEVVIVRNTVGVETIQSGLWLGYDYEAPQNTALTYRAYLIDDADEIIILTAQMTGSIDYGGDYLMVVGRPELAMNIYVEYGGVSGLERPVMRDMVSVVGRPSPMVVSWGRQMWSGGINFLTLEEFERRRILAIMGFPVVMFVSRAGFGFDQPVFLSPGSVTEERTTGLGSEQSRRWLVELNEIARPPSYYPPPAAAVSWQDRLDETRTWQQVHDLPESWFTYGGYDLL